MYANTLERYAGIVGHSEPIADTEMTRIIHQHTGKKHFQGRVNLLVDGLGIDRAHIPPDLVMFNLDWATDEAELTSRFGWMDFSATAAARVLGVLEEPVSQDWAQKLESRIGLIYPTLKPVLQHQKLRFPARYFFERYTALITTAEQAPVEEGIRMYGISPTQYAVVGLISRGKTNQEASTYLNMNYQTVKNHISEVLIKLNHQGENDLYDRTQIAIVAIREGLFPPSLITRLPESSKIPRLSLLSDRESEVFECLVQGMANKEIGTALTISAQTVKNHVASILQKLRCRSRHEVMLIGTVDALRRSTIVPELFSHSR